MSTAEDVVAKIDRDELVELVLKICNIDSPAGYEAEVADYLDGWMRNEGFSTRKIGLLKDRFNVMGKLRGTGGGFSLLFNSHMDTTPPREPDLTYKDPTALVYHSAWCDGDTLVGEGVANDKGPLAAFLIAARAIKASGHQLKGDVILTAVVGETSPEPCDDAPGVVVHTKDLGARFLVTHGGVADYALIAEGTGFGLCWVEAGKLWYKVTLTTDQPSTYTPYLPKRTTLVKSPNMIVAAAAAIEAIEKWAADYEERQVYKSPGGTVVAKAQIGAIRSGQPTRPFRSPAICQLYLEVRALPGQDPLAAGHEIHQLLTNLGLDNTVELYHYRRGYEAKGIERLAECVVRSHHAIFGEDPKPPFVETSSMWRDINIFNEVGIPALTYGPRPVASTVKHGLTIESLYQAACAYARIAVDLCNQEKPPHAAS
jgi:acetylornithine deacetylase/succinyl-diaminopimelate desuccinylase-like protein